jgi:hypothetical protein
VKVNWKARKAETVAERMEGQARSFCKYSKAFIESASAIVEIEIKDL